MLVSTTLWLLIGFGVLFIIVPIVVFIVFWFSSFKKKAVLIREVGESEDDSFIQFIDCKTQDNDKLGMIIRFFPFSGLPISKRFSSNYWRTFLKKGKSVEAIVLYVQGDNYRPVLLRPNGKLYDLVVKNEDNREFKMDKVMSEIRWNDDSKLYLWSILGFFIYVFLLSLGAFLFIMYMKDQTTQAFLLAKTLPIGVV